MGFESGDVHAFFMQGDVSNHIKRTASDRACCRPREIKGFIGGPNNPVQVG